MFDIKSMIWNGNAIGHRRLFLLCAVSWCVMLQCAVAQVVERSTMIAVGTSNRLDTYLSPQDYKGFDARFVSSVLRQKPVEDALITDLELTHDAGIDYTDNQADNANTLAGHYDFAFSMMHRWKMLDGKLTVRAGAMAELYVGFAYNMHNSANNPAQGYASLGIGANGMASYMTPFTIRNRPISINYEARLPLVGMMFSPNYGQSYYEIFVRDDYDNNVVFTSIATPSLRHQLTIDLPIWKQTSFSVGYLGDIRQATPNSLKQHIYTNAVVIGVKQVIGAK